MAVNLSPIGNDAPFVDSNGDPLSGGLLYTYTSGSSTPENTYTTAAGSVANANPIVLNSSGYPASGGSVVEIWLTAGVSYKFVLKNSGGTTLWTRDDIDGINDTSVTIDQWIAGAAPTYISATSFSLVGDQTSTYQVGRRLKTTNSGGTIYSTITASAFGAATTVTVVNDSGSLDAGLSAVYYGILSATNPSTPLLTDAYPIVSGSSDKTKKLRIEVDGVTAGQTRTITVPDANLILAKQYDTVAAHATTCDPWGAEVVLLSGSAVTFTDLADADYVGQRVLLLMNAAHVWTDGAVFDVQGGATYTTAAGDWVELVATAVDAFDVTIFPALGQPVSMQPITASLGADVALNNTSNYFSGPAVAQGTAGKWFVSGTITCEDTAGAATFYAKLWDGATVIASTASTSPAANNAISITLSGYISAPAGNLRIDARDITSTSGQMRYNETGDAKDCTITAIRIA